MTKPRRAKDCRPLGLVPGGGLEAHEGLRRGHTLLKHVNVTDAMIRSRVLGGQVKVASRFFNRALAEDAVSGALVANRLSVEQFLRSSKSFTFIEQSFNREIGTIFSKAGGFQAGNTVRVMLVRDSSELGYFVRTAFVNP